MALVNADLGDGRRAALRLRGARILGLGTPARGDAVVDLHGDRLLPGLINAHDHLQLNTFPPLSYPVRYRNAGEWIRDFNARLRAHTAVRQAAAAPRRQRLLAGGLKNLLSGVTTVAHHDPFDDLLAEAAFPCHVLREYGWAHSLYVDGAAAVRAACAATPAHQPWIIHAAEGTDATAQAEFEQLRHLGCLRANTLLVHGVALDPQQRQQLGDCGAGLIWCPSSNLRLLGRTADVHVLAERRCVALGSDSRLTADGDLLDELRVAAACVPSLRENLERLVTSDAARLLRLADRGVLLAGAAADLVVIPAAASLAELARRDVRLVLRDGQPLYADGDYARQLGGDWVELEVDGRRKFLAAHVAEPLAVAAVTLPGVSLPAAAGRAACG